MNRIGPGGRDDARPARAVGIALTLSLHAGVAAAAWIGLAEPETTPPVPISVRFVEVATVPPAAPPIEPAPVPVRPPPEPVPLVEPPPVVEAPEPEPPQVEVPEPAPPQLVANTTAQTVAVQQPPSPPPPPKPESKPKPKPTPKPKPKPEPVRPPQPKVEAAPVPESAPVPVVAPTPAPAPAPVASAPPASAVPAASAVASASSTQAAPAQPFIEPRYNASYLRNPPPAYPRLSRRLGEHGRVVLRVRVEADGRPSQLEVQRSSGSLRLDEAAVDAVRRWSFVAARRGEQSIAAWVLVPMEFRLNDG